MSRKYRSTPSIAFGALVTLAGITTSGTLLADTGYVLSSSGGYIQAGSSCLLTQRWTPEMAVRECHPELVAQREQREADAKRAEIAALEEARTSTPKPEMVLSEIRVDSKALFDFDTATLRPDGKAKLDELITQINTFRNVSSIVVEGYTDRIGSEAYNESLSRQRAQAVSDYLSATGAIPAERIRVSGQGERNPVQACEGVRGSQALIQCLEPNRRVEVTVMGLEERQAQ